MIEVLKSEGILAGNFYWYANNWHYIRKWDHLKTAKSLYGLSADQQKALTDLQNTTFEKSDEIMSKCVSTAISLTWTEEQVHEKGARLFLVLQQALS